jgi:hypothetical protein
MKSSSKNELSLPEQVFVGAFIFEGSDIPFTGPATEQLRSLGIFSDDILNLIRAFAKSEKPGKLSLGNPLPDSFQIPWRNREVILSREKDFAELPN